jgi:hypothetical protein
MATRSTLQQIPTRSQQTADQKRFYIKKIKERIAALDAFDPSTIQQGYDVPSEIKELDVSIKDLLKKAFDKTEFNYNRYIVDLIPFALGCVDLEEKKEKIIKCIKDKRASLNAAVKNLEEQLDYDEIPAPVNQPIGEAASLPQGFLNQNHFHLNGPNARVSVNSHDQSTNTVNIQASDFEPLAQELGQLREALATQAKDGQDQIIIDAVAEAEEGAKEKDNAKISKALSALGRAAGDWVLKVAGGIGVPLATKYLEKHLL